MDRTEAGRCCDDDEITLIDHALVSVEAGVLAALGEINLGGLAELLDLLLDVGETGGAFAAAVDLVLERIGHGDELGAVARGEVLHDRSGATATETDEAHLHGVAAGDLGAQLHGEGGGGTDHGGTGDEAAAGNGLFFLLNRFTHDF